jgi:circadian clock protein KaiB
VLFVAGNSPKGRAADANLRKALADLHLSRLTLETVDAFDDPERALRERVFITPTLIAVKCALRVVGDLSDREQLAYFLRSVRDA